jgi:alpha-ketoglutarate-dependent taurine dioxygenase
MLATGRLIDASRLRHQRIAPFGLVVEAAPGRRDLLQTAMPPLRELVNEHRLVVLRGFDPLDRDGLVAFASSWGRLLEWNFGTVLELVEHDRPANYLFTSGSVPFHWDGAFAQETPWLQVFQCLQAPRPGTGGETLFADTTRIWQDASTAQRARWEQTALTYATDKVAHYGGRITAPLVAVHPATGERIVRFAEPPNETTADLNPLAVEAPGLSAGQLDELIRELCGLLYDPRYCYAHPWEQGDFVVADNHALLHGRKAYLAHSPRHLRRIHVL